MQKPTASRRHNVYPCATPAEVTAEWLNGSEHDSEEIADFADHLGIDRREIHRAVLLDCRFSRAIH